MYKRFFQGSENNSETKKGKLAKEWASYLKLFKRQPIDHIKDYFGVKVALYFAWLGFYTYMLLPAAIFGLICVIYGSSNQNEDIISEEICKTDIKMCPACDQFCDYENLNETCWFSRATHIFDHSLTVIFAFLMSLWSALYLESWKRYSAEITHRWGLTGYDLSGEYPRTQFLEKCHNRRDAAIKMNPITRQVEPKVSYWATKIPRMFVSYSTVIVLVSN